MQFDIVILIGILKPSQNSLSSKSEMSLQYLEKEVRYEVGFLHTDKHLGFLQVDFNTFGYKVSSKVILSFLMDMIKHFKSSQSNKFAIFWQYFKKEVRNGVHFLHADNH